MDVVDANVKSLRERIEKMKAKERLDRCYRSERYGWCYPAGYDHTLKKNARTSESLELILMACKTFGLTVVTSSFLLCIFSFGVDLCLLHH